MSNRSAEQSWDPCNIHEIIVLYNSSVLYSKVVKLFYFILYNNLTSKKSADEVGSPLNWDIYVHFRLALRSRQAWNPCNIHEIIVLYNTSVLYSKVVNFLFYTITSKKLRGEVGCPLNWDLRVYIRLALGSRQASLETAGWGGSWSACSGYFVRVSTMESGDAVYLPGGQWHPLVRRHSKNVFDFYNRI